MVRKTRKQKGGEDNNNLPEISFNNIQTGNVSETVSLRKNSNTNNNNTRRVKRIKTHNVGNVTKKNFGHYQRGERKSLTNIQPRFVGSLSSKNKQTLQNYKSNNAKIANIIEPKLKRLSGSRGIKLNNSRK